jgi:hypothetical protein
MRTNRNPIESIHERMNEKAREDKEYHMNVWKSHINQLSRLVPDGLTFDRWQELRAELIDAADKQWAA